MGCCKTFYTNKLIKEMTTKLKLILGASAVLILLAVAGNLYFNAKADAKRWKENYNTEKSAFSTYRDKATGLEVAYKQQILLTEKELRKELKANDSLKGVVKHYKELSEVITVITEWKHDTINVPLPIFIARDTTVNLSDSCFKAKLDVFQGGIKLHGLSVTNKQDIVTGVRKMGFMKTEYSFDILNSNKCVSVTGMQSYKVIHKPKFYERPVFLISTGILAGYFIFR